MNDNPCTKDLTAVGWTDFNNVLIVARSEEMLNSYIEKTHHIYYSLHKEDGKQFANCVIQDEIEIFQNIIDEMGLTNDIKLMIAEREELYLNEILDKINNSGKESLTSREYSFLNFVKYLD
jgi:hypothetical protein